MTLPSHPILTCDAAGRLEAKRFGGDEAKEWPAMQQAGRAVAGKIGTVDQVKVTVFGEPDLGGTFTVTGEGKGAAISGY